MVAAMRLAWTFLSLLTALASPPHPGSAKFLGKTLAETLVHRVNGDVVATAAGKFACDYGALEAPFYLRASWNGTVQLKRPRASGATSLQVTWLGWNNLLTNRVDRYLIVREVASSGTVLEHCTTYPDVNPKGYKDPLPLMADRYKLVNSSSSSSEYMYQWHLQSGADMTSAMVADVSGWPPKSVAVSSKTLLGQVSSYDFTYGAPERRVDSSIFYEYKKYKCSTVSNFTTPQVCVDSWLALQYECDFTDIPATTPKPDVLV